MQSGEHGYANKPTPTCGNAISKQSDSSSHEFNMDPNLLNVAYIYRQDVVRKKINNKIGIVTEVAGNSDSDSSVTDDEDEDEGEKDDESDSNEEGDMENGNLDESAVGNSDDNDYDCTPLTADQVRVLWMDEYETTESTHDVTVADRGFLHGDYVAAASDPNGQIGIVVDIDINVDLLAHDGSIVQDKRSRDLKRIRDFTVGDHVVLGPWLGRIEDVFDNVTVQLDDGSVCKVMKADPLRLKPVRKNFLKDGHFPYYPGQRVKANYSSVFKNSRWQSGFWKANQLEGTVIKVTVGSVYIHWIASAGYGPDSAISPAQEQSPKSLKLFACFAQTNWQLGDWCLLPSSLKPLSTPLQFHVSSKHEPDSTETDDESDAEDTKFQESTGDSKLMEDNSEASLDQNSETSENISPAESTSCWHLHRKKICKVAVRKEKQARKIVENVKKSFLIINTKTKVDVAWQDGTIKQGLDSTSLIPIDSPGDHEFVAEQYVVEKAADDSNHCVEIRRVGVVKSVDAKDRTACVRWLKPVSRPEDPREFDKEEVVSVYELEGHLDYDYCYGDVVVRLSPVLLPTRMGSFVQSVEDSLDDSTPYERMLHGSTTIETNDVSTDFSVLSWVGNITGLKDGDIEVTWADGMISTVGPQAIYVVGRDDDESAAAGSDSDDDVASWETVEDDNMETFNTNEERGTINAGEVRPEVEEYMNAENSGALSIPLAALALMARLASGIFSRGRKHSNSFNSETNSEYELHSDDLTLNRDPDRESDPQKSNDIEYQLSQLETDHKGKEIIETSDSLEMVEALGTLKLPDSDSPSSCQECILTLKGFDIVRDPIDHYYIGGRGQNSAARKWLKKVQQDWSILQSNLPEGIYVRAYEDRMDLLRAVIVGPYGTPYQDGLFFFDFHLPPEYPDVPPSAYYHSGGWRINPNLYEEGKVCLSLLNTWTGRGNEVWDPSTSSILQVLVSLQGLVLNSKPYFNEAGYDKQVGTAEGEKHSFSYNENTFLLSCKTMMYLIRKSPKDFEELIMEHFRNRGYYILKACDAYMKGHLIGSLTRDASITSYSTANSNSVGFKLMLAKVVPKLFSALTEVGADCQEFKHLIK